MKYPTLDGRIEDTYAKRSTAKLKNSLYDSYIRAFRWAADRIGEAGVVAFVSNGGWVTGNSADGMRLALADEYSAIYVYNLRGNQRTAGEEARREGGKVFGSGSRNTVAIFIGVKNPTSTTEFQLFYRDIGDYLSREEKLRIVVESQLDTVDWEVLTPNTEGDWVDQRDETFGTWPAIGDKSGGIRIFVDHSAGVLTARDTWVYNFSQATVASNVSGTVDFYNDQVDRYARWCVEHGVADRKSSVSNFITADTAKISWGGSLKDDLASGKRLTFDPTALVTGMYRPFQPLRLYFNPQLNQRRYTLPAMFPTPHHQNIGFYVVGTGNNKPFSALMTDLLPDVSFWGSGQGHYFPRWTYEKAESGDGELALDTSSSEIDEFGYRRIDNITDGILALYREAVGDQVTKDDIFYYIYGLLHDPAYRTAYAADLKKMLPHIPTPQTRERFDQLADAGRRLAELHVNYESADQYPLDVQIKPGADPSSRETWRVTKMKWRSKADHTAIVYNGQVTIAGIPEEAERYMLGSRSALAWIIDRYQVKIDKASGIINDPNDWCDEHNDPTYIAELIKRITTVSIETMKIVDIL